VVVLLSLATLSGAILLTAMLLKVPDQVVAGAAALALLLGIAGGLWLKNRIVGQA
jgi:hypothetical protein